VGGVQVRLPFVVCAYVPPTRHWYPPMTRSSPAGRVIVTVAAWPDQPCPFGVPEKAVFA
jgi:hypothetical protein